MKEFKKYGVHYLFLLIILSFGLTSFLAVSKDHDLQFRVAVLTVAAYTGWGFVHHLLKGDLYLKVVVEYVLVAALVIVLLWTVLLRT
ncbi:MAG: hypothetical protein M1120_01915 [Patescibacteria group bacterium]|nr:hypothetical protein [Patescibacteria group bacterium]